MERFTSGTKEQFNILDIQLNDGLCHIFSDCRLPDFCTPSTARIGFEKKAGNEITVLIDYGITADCDNDSFKEFLRDGEKKFSSVDEIEEFFHSFSVFFVKNEDPLYDKDKLLALCEEKTKAKIVRAANISKELKQSIFGQDDALDLLSLRIAAHLNSNIRKPLALILVGPSGVGKTHTGKSITAVISKETGIQYGFISDTLNTVKSEHSIQKYLGAPPSYAGYGDKTVFDAVVENPHHIILMDELDKANPNLLEVLMEALDTGIFNLSNGQKIDMSECIFIFTSNMPIDYDKYMSFDSAFDRTTFCRDTLVKSGIHNSIPRRIDEFIIYTKLGELARASIISGYLKNVLKSYGAQLVKIDEPLMSSMLTLNNTYGGDTIGRYLTSLISNKIEKDELYDSIREKQLVLKGTVKNIEIEIK